MKYDPSLDGLRAIAVLAVVIYHLTLEKMVPGGWAGVDVFFVLSGFLITSILHKELTSTDRIDLKSFYIKRFLRLFPAFIVVVGFSSLAALFSRNYFTEAMEAALFALTYTMNWSRAFNWGGDWMLGHTWSLAMEEQFYVLWPLFMLFVRRKMQFGVTLGLIALITGWRCYLALNGAEVVRTYNGFDTHADALLIGCLLAFKPNIAPSGPTASVLACVALAGIFLLTHLDSVWTQTLGLSAASVVSAVLIASARRDGWLRTVLQWRPFVFTGRISYGLYLWHYPIWFIIYGQFQDWPWAIPVVAILSYAAAVISFFVVERPFLRLKSRFGGGRAISPSGQPNGSGSISATPKAAGEPQGNQ